MIKKFLEKITPLFLHLTFFFLPLQTAWLLQEPMINGVKWQYGTLLIYATQLLVALTALLVFVCKKRLALTPVTENKKENTFSHKQKLVLGLSALFLIINVSLAHNHWLAIQALGFWLTALLVFYCIKNSALFKINWKVCCLSGLLLTACLSIEQFLTQRVFGSTILGLTQHSADQIGASIISWGQGRALRAYGLFPHPNILGAYMVCAVALSLSITKEIKTGRKFWLAFISLPIVTTALFYSFSRTAWLAAGIIIVCNAWQSFFQKEKNWFAPLIIAAAIFIGLALSTPSLITTRLQAQTPAEVRSLNERQEGIQQSFSVIKNNLWFGTGLGNYTLALQEMFPGQRADQYQPVHVVWLLALSEFGITGFALLTVGVIMLFRVGTKTWTVQRVSIILVLILVGSLDHYLYTLYPGNLFVVLFFALF